ncbi:unnamed protein product [Alopecurus aequalis]
MTDHGNETRRRRRRRGATAGFPAGAPPNSSDVLWEIFLRLPPLPSSLPRVSLVCKWWRGLAADPEFLLRFRAHHRQPPLLGLFKDYGGWVSFTPVLSAPDRIPRQRFSMRIDYGGRYGAEMETYPSPTLATIGGAVLCTSRDERHVHGGCHSSPFNVVLVKILYEYEAGGDRQSRGGARVYSSETGMWSDPISAVEQCTSNSVYLHLPSTLVGGSLYWWLRCYSSYNMEILQFDIGTETLSLIDGPPQKLDIYCSQIIQGEDGGVGVAVLSYPSLQLWDWKVDAGDDVATMWVLRKTISLDLVPNMRATQTEIVGYVEDNDAILIKFNDNVFIVQLESAQSEKLCDSFVTHQYHAFTSFYYSGEFGRCKGITSAPRKAPAEPSKHQNPSHV